MSKPTNMESQTTWKYKIRQSSKETGIHHIDGAEYNLDEDVLIKFIAHEIKLAEEKVVRDILKLPIIDRIIVVDEIELYAHEKGLSLE